METVTVTSLRWSLLSVCLLAFTSAEQEAIQVNVTVGKTAILPCKAPKKNSITVVEWSRPDLKPECVFLYRNGQIDVYSQNPVFKNRVDLEDKQMKDGDVDLNLKNVSINDTGTYECRVKTTKRTKRGVDPIRTITLRVVAPPPGQPGGATEDEGREDGVSRGRLGLLAFPFVLGVVAAVGFLSYRKQSQDSYHQPPKVLAV